MDEGIEFVNFNIIIFSNVCELFWMGANVLVNFSYMLNLCLFTLVTLLCC